MVENLKYKNKTYPISVGYYAMKHTSAFLKDKGKGELNMDALLSQDIEVLEPLLYYSLVSGARQEDTEMNLKMEDMEFMLDEVMFQFTEAIPKFFPQQTNPAPTQEGGAGKKRPLKP